MGNYNKILYHLVISTKDRDKTINDENCDNLYHYIWGICKNKNCTLYRINGVSDHIHMAFSLNPIVPLSGF